MGFKLSNKEVSVLMQSQAFQKFVSMQLPARISYPLAMLTAELNRAMELFQSERMKIVERLCDRDDDGKLKQEGEMFFFNENREEFTREMEDLLTIEVSVKADKLTLDLVELEKIDIKLSPVDLVGLGTIITFILPEEKDTVEADPKKVVPISKDRR